MEELVLTDPVTEPAKTKASFRVVSLLLDYEAIALPQPPPPAPQVPGLMRIQLQDNLGNPYRYEYVGQVAQDYIKFINTANFTINSLHKRILQRLSTDGVLPGSVAGTPDPPTLTVGTATRASAVVVRVPTVGP
jgi:hypothetical protein